MKDYKGLIVGTQSPIDVDTKHWKFGIIEHGKKIIDPQMHYTSFPLGYYDDHGIIDTVCANLKKYKPEVGDNLFKTFTPTLNSPHVELCQKLYDMSNGYRTLFALSGSDGVEAAVKLASQYHQLQGRTRKKIVSFTDSYHGATSLTLSISGCDFGGFHGMKPYADVIKISPDMHETVDWDSVSCIVIETCPHILNLGPYTDAVYEKIKNIQKQHNVIVIVDDIWMAGGKTGSFFGFDQLPINPDIFVQGKAITGGFFPLSTVMYNQQVHDTVKDGAWIHGHTYSFSLAGVLSMIEYIKVLEHHGYMNTVNDNIQRAQKVFEKYSVKCENYGCAFFVQTATSLIKFVIPLNADDEYFEAIPDTIKLWHDYNG